MTRGQSLRRLIKGSGMNIMIRFEGIDEAIPAETAIRIWEQLNVDADLPKQDPAHVDPEKKKPEEPKDKRKKLDDGKMLALRKAGWTYEKIADEMGCSTQTVINHIKDKE